MSIQVIKRYSLWLCLFIVTLPAYASPQVVGHIIFVKGTNTAQLSGTTPRAIDKDADIFQGDTIQTTESSFVIVEFTDGAKVTVRPNSNFSIDHYDNQSADKNAQLVLNKGEVNAVTGQITADNPENFQITTPTGTVKPQSTKAEFTVNICKKDCDKSQEAAQANQKIRLEQNLVARVVEIKGEVSAINRSNKDAKERILSLGKPLYNTDFIHSKKDSWALLVFPDGEKLTLQPDSEMDIKQYNYHISGKKDRILLHLAMGGLRALTGSIGENDHDAFELDTPVATIGIRGTETFTVITEGDSPSSVNIDHSTLQGISFAKYVDNNGKSNESVVPAGSSLQMAGSPPPPSAAAPAGGAPAAVVVKPPVVKPTPPDAPKPQGPPLIPDPAATKALFEVKAAPLVTIVKMISGSGKIVSINGQNSAPIEPGSTGSIKPNSDLTIMSPINSSDQSTNNTNESTNTNTQANTVQQETTQSTTSNTSTTSSTSSTSTQSELQVTNIKQLIDSVSPD